MPQRHVVKAVSGSSLVPKDCFKKLSDVTPLAPLRLKRELMEQDEEELDDEEQMATFFSAES